MASPGHHTAFFYGTLMSPAVLHRVTGAPRSLPASKSQPFYTTRAAILPSHQRRHVLDADYPAVTPAGPNDSVRGTYVTGLRDSDMFRLDRFEGEEYARRKVRVRLLPAGETTEVETDRQSAGYGHTGKDEEKWVDTETYIWIASVSQLDSKEWDFEEFLRTKLWRWGPDSAEYAESDAAVAEHERQSRDATGGRQWFNGDREEAEYYQVTPVEHTPATLGQEA